MKGHVRYKLWLIHTTPGVLVLDSDSKNSDSGLTLLAKVATEVIHVPHVQEKRLPSVHHNFLRVTGERVRFNHISCSDAI